MLQTTLRTHTCGELRASHTSKTTTLCGWVQSRRDHGGIIFVDLRDRDGITQIVFDPNDTNKESFGVAEKLRREDCIQITGTVRPRGEGLTNPRLTTGEIEIIAKECKLLCASQTPPFEIDENAKVNDDLRLEYRYLDLRRAHMQRNLKARSKAAHATRKYLIEQEGFTEIETPILMKSTPEGARDYVVPSRVNAGKFYALPQSPQIYKQLLMVGGCDRYFQIARCFRDEDLRADRQPEFTQIDFEMSFVEHDDVFRVIEGTCKAICDSFGMNIQIPFPRITHKQAMEKYSSDKPDMRFEMFTYNVTDIAAKSDFSVFKDVVSRGGIVKCIAAPVELARKDVDRYIEFAQSNGAKGMAWMRVQNGKCESNIAKYFSEDVQKEIVARTKATEGSTLMFIADAEAVCHDVINRLRIKVAQDNNMIPPNTFAFVWVLDFPLFEKNPESPTGWSPAHHMFTMPNKEHLQYIPSNPEKVYADCYDLAMNGVELGSGSIRCHLPDLQRQIMEIVGYPQKDAEERFGFLMKSFTYGAPPHGGFAIGFDRIVALLSGTSDIREVISFPKNKSAQCPMDGSPSAITQTQLKELHINVRESANQK